MFESIFEVYYKLDAFDILIEGDFIPGPITNSSTINDLTELVNLFHLKTKKYSRYFLDANNCIELFKY